MSGTAFILLLAVQFTTTYGEGGDCYETYKADTKECFNRFTTNITKSDCCNLEGVSGTHFGWTATDASSADIFRQIIRPDGGGTPGCMPCKVDCDDVECGPEMKCKMRNGRPRCVCNLNCSKFDPEYEGPVCGTNDKTYARSCDLYRQRCRSRESFEIAYYGVCSTNSCENVTCPNGRHCIQDRNDRPYCVECRAICQNADGSFVCGSDNITYESRCHLQLHSCRFTQITKISDHRCNGTLDTCEFTSCMDGNKCEDTDEGAKCISCGFVCTNADYKSKVCGSDNSTYVDRCALMTERCRNNPDLELTLNTSCDGERPVSIPPFILQLHNNVATNTEQSWPSNDEYDEGDDEEQITDSYRHLSDRPFTILDLKTSLQTGTGRPRSNRLNIGHHGNKKQINQTKKQNQSTKKISNRHFGPLK